MFCCWPGSGYHLVMVTRPACVVDTLTSVITRHVPSAKLENQASAELTYILPQSETSRFEPLLAYIEQNMLQLGVRSFGISMATMEEVFLK